MSANSFAIEVGKDFNPNPENNVFESLFKQYERVVFQSVITSFGLDLFIKDRAGGDVDTIHNVRKGVDYKNASNADAYEKRGDYNSNAYHSHPEYRKANKQYRQQRETGELDDAYTGKRFARNESHDLDHVIAAKKVHDDAGRVLSGLDGVDLANSPENLRATNQRTNRTKKADDMDTFLNKYGNEYTDEEKAKMIAIEKESRIRYDRKINTAYYTSKGFWKDTGIAAAKMSAKMGLRQALGFVMTEVWFSVKDALTVAGNSFADKLKAIAIGIKQGFARAKENFKELLSKFGGGAVSGILSSLTTTLCNIFFTTAKNVVRIIRQTWASIVEAAKILIFNPDCLPFAERMKAALKILAVGASVVLGTVVQEAVHKALLPHVGVVPALGDTLLTIVSIFAGTLCSGFLTVTLLYFIDSNPFGNFFTSSIDKTITEYKRQARMFQEYAAKLQQLDFAKFEQETTMYHNFANSIETVKDDRELNTLLIQAVKQIGVSIPWGEGRSLNEFMNDKNAVLSFKA